MIKEFKKYEPIDYKSKKKQVAYLKTIFDDYAHAQSFADTFDSHLQKNMI